MRTLLFHCKNYQIKIRRLANRPKNIEPEKLLEKEQGCKNCIVAMITVEKNDLWKDYAPSLAKEILSMCEEVDQNNVVLLPFAHLSNNLADAKDSINAINFLENLLKERKNVIRAHFGSHKELLLDIYGHPGNARYREFYAKGD